MHAILTGVCLALLVSVAMLLVRTLKGPTIYDRVLGINAVGTKTVVIVACLGFFGAPEFFVDTSIVYALVNFVATIGILKFIEQRRLD